jgi:hypothetical protein
MAKATRVLSTPPTNTPVDTTRRRFLTVAAVGSMIGAGIAFAAAAPNDVPKAVTVPRHSRPDDPAFVLIADKLAGDIAHCEAIDAQDEADERGVGLDVQKMPPLLDLKPAGKPEKAA